MTTTEPTTLDFTRACAFCGSYWMTLPGNSSAVCVECIDAIGGAAEAVRIRRRNPPIRKRDEAALQRIADAMYDWLATCCPGWASGDIDVDDYEVELARARAAADWLRLHGFNVRDWASALANLCSKRRQALDAAKGRS